MMESSVLGVQELGSTHTAVKHLKIALSETIADLGCQS
jgi:hypothetical protein